MKTRGSLYDTSLAQVNPFTFGAVEIFVVQDWLIGCRNHLTAVVARGLARLVVAATDHAHSGANGTLRTIRRPKNLTAAAFAATTVTPDAHILTFAVEYPVHEKGTSLVRVAMRVCESVIATTTLDRQVPLVHVGIDVLDLKIFFMCNGAIL